MGRRTNTAVWHDKYQRWQINVQKDGVRRSFYSSTPGREGHRECDEKADAWLDDGLINSNMKVSILFDQWIEELKITTSKSHWGQYEGYGRKWIKPNVGGICIGSLTEQHLQNVITSAYTGKLSKKSLTNIKNCMCAFIKHCRKGKATKLIVENLSIPRGATVGERKILQPDDLKKLFSYDQSLIHGLESYEILINAYRFEVITGLRPGEVIGLKKNDIRSNMVKLRRSINKFDEKTKGKNQNACRDFILTPLAHEIINKQEQKLNELGISSKYVFPDTDGEHIKPWTYYKRWVKYRDYVGIVKASPYELRHTFVSVVKTLPEGLLKQLIGHSKDMDTYGTYSHIVTGDMEETAKLVQSIFSSILKQSVL